VLHHTPASATLDAVVSRAASQQKLTALLPDGWRQQSDISKRVGTWSMRAMAGGGLKVEDLSDEERAKRGLLKDQLAMHVTGVGSWGLHGTGKQRGFQKDDIVIAVEGLKGRHSESAFIGALLQAYPKKTDVKTTVLRNGQSVELKLPMQ
jgi:serine protease Do